MDWVPALAATRQALQRRASEVDHCWPTSIQDRRYDRDS